ncbi:hypothetical protein FQN50_005830 [Emmonsiellopsis sp. PD_5]|nr:hypothetical protein FQN50_005830 [Emmonsiellopsis sp. PD_5]
MLLAFVDKVGHKYDYLLQGAAEISNSEVKEEDDLMLLAATRQMDFARRGQGEYDEDDGGEPDRGAK